MRWLSEVDGARGCRYPAISEIMWHPLINLLWRILAGERLERGSKRDSAYWLAALAVLPVMIGGFGAVMAGIEAFAGFSFDSLWSLMAFFVAVGLFSLWLIFTVATAFARRPLWLIPVSLLTWGLSGWLFFKQFG